MFWGRGGVCGCGQTGLRFVVVVVVVWVVVL